MPTTRGGTFLCKAANHNVCASTPDLASNCACSCHYQDTDINEAVTVQEAVTRLAWQFWASTPETVKLTDEVIADALHHTLAHYNGEGHITLPVQASAFVTTIRSITAHPTWWAVRDFHDLYRKNLYAPPVRH